MPASRRPNDHDISLGENEWLAWVSTAGRQSRAVPFDDRLEDWLSFWQALETECVAGCCGIDAFCLWPDAIREASEAAGPERVRNGLTALHDFVEESDADIFVSQRLNNHLDRSVLLAIIEHVERNLPPRSPQPEQNRFGDSAFS